MSTFPPIQPRPILCKTITNNGQSSSPMFFVPPSSIPNNSFYQANSEFSQTSYPPAPLSPSEEFVKRLRDFHRSRQTTFRYLPSIAGRTMDLHLLYNTVVNHGGWEKVTDRQLWSSIAQQFSIDSSHLNGTEVLKNIYIRYLYAFEKLTNGENVNSHEDENDDSKRRTASHLQRVPQSYNHSQHAVPEPLRIQYGLSTDLVHRNEFEKLELSLIGGFPNELTFTLNTLLLLSSSSIHSKAFHLYKCPRLLDLLYRHIGLFLASNSSNNECDFKILSEQIWSRHLDYQLDLFWLDSCSPKILKLLLNIEINTSHSHFNTNTNKNVHEQEFRIEQILMIIRNLSFDRLNALYLLESIQSTSSLTYLFLLLISHCQKKVELQKYAYDIWTNLACYMHLHLISKDEGLWLRQLLQQMLMGDEDEAREEDRLKIIRALEIIGHLAQAGNSNAIYLLDYIPVMINNLINVPDILILVHTLECLYQLSELGEQSCDTILEVQSASSMIIILINLLTIEARSFSTQSMKTIKIVEMSNGPVLLQSYQQPQPVLLISTSQQQPPPHPIYSVENPEMTKPKFFIQQQQQPKPTVRSLLSVSTEHPSLNEKKRKFDLINESVITNGIASKAFTGDFDGDIRACLNELCHRVEVILDPSISQLPSPVFKRKIDTQTIKSGNHQEEQANPTPTYDYFCEWDHCRASFPTPRSVFQHVCSTHIKHCSDYVCLWTGCDRLKRQKWSLISHLQERHCSEMAFRQAKLKQTNPVHPTPSIVHNPPLNNNRVGTIGYAPDAAWHAIRRHMQVGSLDDHMVKTKEGPLTKNIRLTSALILRNIARYSSIGKQTLRPYEAILANLALESSEASQTLSSCLFELSN